MSEIQIGKKKIGNGYPVYIVAEGCDNHIGGCRGSKGNVPPGKTGGGRLH